MFNQEELIKLVRKLTDEAYIEGLKDGIHMFAINKDGKLLVGTMQREYSKVIETCEEDARMTYSFLNRKSID